MKYRDDKVGWCKRCPHQNTCYGDSCWHEAASEHRVMKKGARESEDDIKKEWDRENWIIKEGCSGWQSYGF